MDLVFESNGNLTFQLSSEEDREQMEIFRDRHPDDRAFMADALDYFGHSGNNRLNLVAPEAIGALTDAPIVTDDMLYGEEGQPQPVGRIWWYPNYQVRHCGDVLLTEGKVTFQRAAMH